MVPAWRNSLGVSAHQCQAGQPSPRGASVASTDSAAFHGVYSSVRNAENIGELELKGRAFLYSGLHLWIFNFRVLLMVTVISVWLLLVSSLTIKLLEQSLPALPHVFAWRLSNCSLVYNLIWNNFIIDDLESSLVLGYSSAFQWELATKDRSSNSQLTALFAWGFGFVWVYWDKKRKFKGGGGWGEAAGEENYLFLPCFLWNLM